MNAIAHSPTTAMSGSKLDNRRMLAALIDLAVVGAGAAVILFAAGVLGGDGAGIGAPLAAVVAGWGLYYYFACESGGGQTLGKKLMNLRVVRVDGSDAGMSEVAVRTALRVVDTVVVGLVTMLVTGERRARVGDLAAGTMIVSADGPPAVTHATAVAVPAAATMPEAPVVDEERFAEDLAEERFAEDLAEERFAQEAVVEEDLDHEGELAVEEPVVEEPVVEEPVVDEPVVEDAVLEEPALSEPAPAESGPAEQPVDDGGVVTPLAVAPEVAVEEPVADLSLVPDPVAPLSVVEAPPLEELGTPDIATPSLKELADDVAATKASAQREEPAEVDAVPVVETEPVVQAEPVEEPAIDEIVDGEVVEEEGPVHVRSVDTVSAIDLIMGDDEPAQDSPAAPDEPVR
jgi:uncharacterized RDD family membrane protein YckC